MRFIRFAAFIVTVVSLMAAWSSSAQTVTETSGAINGIVTDSSNAVLPGVTVVLTGAGEMSKPQTSTSSNGSFAFPAVPPGDYVLTFTMQGFSTTKQEGVHVGIGFIATVNASMKPGSIDQTVDVTAASAPVLDVVNPVIATHFDTQKLEDLPGTRDINAALAATPAVSMATLDVGGSQALNLQAYTAYGLTSTTGVNRNNVEGIRVGADNGANDNYFPDYGAFSEIVINTVANSAVMSNPGTFEQYVNKSGGSQYHADVYYDYEGKTLQSANIDASQIALGVAGSPTFSVYDINRLNKFTDFDAGIGGYIVKDKLWWFGGYRYTELQYGEAWLTDGAASLDDSVYTAKGTYNVTPKQKLIGFYQYNFANQPDYFSAGSSLPFETLSSLPKANTPFTVFKGEYNIAISNSVYFEARWGAYLSGFNTHSKNGDPRINDTGANTTLGGASNTGLTRNRPQGNFMLSYVKNGWGISHTFKIGGESMVDHLISPFGGYNDACDCVSNLINGAPSTVQIYQPNNISKSDLWTYAWYIDDTWKVKRRLSLSLGTRMDIYKPSLPAQIGPAGQQFAAASNFPTFVNWVPRLGFTYAVTRDQKNVVKMHYGESYVYPGVNFTSAFNPNSSGWYTTYKWTTDPTHLGYWVPADGLGPATASSGGTSNTKLDPNIKNTYVRQATAYFEREVGSDIGVRGGFVWNGRRQLYLTVNTALPFSAFTKATPVVDPGPDNKTPGATYTGLDIATATPPPAVNTETNIPIGDSDYYTMEFTATKRDVGRWSLLASFAKTWSHETAAASSATYNPNAFINTNNGYNDYNTWQAKASGTGSLPWKFKIIPTLRVQSGTPYGRTFTHTFNYGTTTILAEPVGTRRTPDIALFDTRVEKMFLVKEKFLLTGFFDVYNVFNANGAETVTQSSGSAFLRPTAIVGPRIVRFGAKFSF